VFDQSTNLVATQNMVAMTLHARTNTLPQKASCARMETVSARVRVASGGAVHQWNSALKRR